MKSKTIVITGATGVLGNLVAKTFAERGDNIVLLDRDQVKLDSLTASLNLPSNRIHAQTIDLLDAQALHDSAEAVHSKFGSIHALIHLVGGWVGGKTIPESSRDDLEFMLNQHVWTTFNLCSNHSRRKLLLLQLGTGHHRLTADNGEACCKVRNLRGCKICTGKHGVDSG